MAQTKIYGRADVLPKLRQSLSDAIHSCVVDALGLPNEKRFQRFLPLAPEDFLYPPDRSSSYVIIEIGLFAGRSAETKKRLIRLLFERIERRCGLQPNDVEIALIETSPADWGIRGLPADELSLNYHVKV